jgi:hypothetical protein
LASENLTNTATDQDFRFGAGEGNRTLVLSLGSPDAGRSVAAVFTIRAG